MWSTPTSHHKRIMRRVPGVTDLENMSKLLVITTYYKTLAFYRSRAIETLIRRAVSTTGRRQRKKRNGKSFIVSTF